MNELNLVRDQVKENISPDDRLNNTYYRLLERDWLILYDENKRLNAALKNFRDVLPYCTMSNISMNEVIDCLNRHFPEVFEEGDKEK